MNTISRVAKQFNLSRSTLLYYDSIGILSPSQRTEAGYRIYSKKDIERLEKICMYRQTGIPLPQIKKLLSMKKGDISGILENHLDTINQEISRLRTQQHILIELLKNKKLTKKSRVMNKETWVNVLRSTGLTDEEMDKWHQEFEALAPNAHQDFLESLGISNKEIKRIRTHSKS